MGATTTFSEVENIVNGLSKKDKSRLYRWLEKEIGIGGNEIVSHPEVMGGAACIRNTRIPVWVLVQARDLGVGEADLLRNYPNLTAADLTRAWSYWASNKSEIEKAISANEADEE